MCIFFLPEECTFTLACTVRSALWDASALEAGKVEQFPNCKSYDSWYKPRLPMQRILSAG